MKRQITRGGLAIASPSHFIFKYIICANVVSTNNINLSNESIKNTISY